MYCNEHLALQMKEEDGLEVKVVAGRQFEEPAGSNDGGLTGSVWV